MIVMNIELYETKKDVEEQWLCEVRKTSKKLEEKIRNVLDKHYRAYEVINVKFENRDELKYTAKMDALYVKLSVIGDTSVNITSEFLEELNSIGNYIVASVKNTGDYTTNHYKVELYFDVAKLNI